MNPAVGLVFLYLMGNDLVNSYMSNPVVNEFLKEDEKFDVCVIEIFNADAMLVSLMLNRVEIMKLKLFL